MQRNLVTTEWSCITDYSSRPSEYYQQYQSDTPMEQSIPKDKRDVFIQPLE